MEALFPKKLMTKLRVGRGEGRVMHRSSGPREGSATAFETVRAGGEEAVTGTPGETESCTMDQLQQNSDPLVTAG